MTYTSENYLNRELSWLEFNQRVLDVAALPEVPLLERVKFLAISGSNLDEFFKVRVGGLRLALKAGIERTELTGLTVSEELQAITSRVRDMYEFQSDVFANQLLPELSEKGIVRLLPDQMNDEQYQTVKDRFSKEIAATVSPIAIADHPFPLLATAKQCICVRLRLNPSTVLGNEDAQQQDCTERFMVIPIGSSLSRLIKLPRETGLYFMMIEDVIGMFLPQLFPDQEILDWATFRITRNADIALNDDAMHDLLTEMTNLLEKRRVSEIIRLEVSHSASPPLLQFLKDATAAPEEQIFSMAGPLDLAALFELAGVEGFRDLKFEPWPPQASPDFADEPNIFDAIAAADRVLIHPYQSFDPVVNFVRMAAEDPHVIAIKHSLYRTSRDSEIIKALMDAARNGKQVTTIVELKARFDEARNIFGAKQLEQAGVDVIYGVQGLKTHAKMCLVVRREPRGIQRYVHFGTGNYNESTARLYSDISYFTNREQHGADAVLFFNAITGLSVPQNLKKLAAAPINLKDTLLELIQVEIQNAKQGGACEITAKLNSLVEKSIIDALYDASQAGVRIRLNIRGICCLRPGVAGLSDNIEVISIVDRFLEHARIIHFHHGGENLVFISSADWMGRNLNRRAELLVPIEDNECKHRIKGHLDAYFSDNIRATRLDSSGRYRPIATTDRGNEFRAQEYLYQEACDLYAAFSNPKATVFKAHRGETA